MAEKKLSEELRHCLEGNGCADCTCCEPKTVLTCRGLLQKAYETVKEHEEIHEIMRPLAEILNEFTALEEQGLLLKPKCVPGDYAWEINKERNIISEYEVSSIRYGINKTFRYMWALRDGIYGELDGFWDKDIGKTVFLSKEAAEKALKEMEDRRNGEIDNL